MSNKKCNDSHVKESVLALLMAVIIVLAVTLTLTLCSSPVHASESVGKDDSSDGIRVSSDEAPVYACFDFSEYLDIYNLAMSGNREGFTRAAVNAKGCAVLKNGLEYAISDRKDRWYEIIIFNGGETVKAYTFPTLE